MARALADLTGNEAHWLHEGEALESAVASTAAGLTGEIARLLKDRPVDSAIVPAAGRRKRLLIADMDSTMIEQECIDELGALAGAGDRIRAVTASAMRGELEFEDALKARLALLKGLPEDAIATILAKHITFTQGGRTLVATMKTNGAYTALVSGGFRQFTRPVAQQLGFDEDRANELVITDGRLAGTAREPILGKDAKLSALHDLAKRLGIGLAETMAVGDGANDIPMLRHAGIGIALHAKPKVQEAAPVHINHGDLTALLYLQGYRREEFVAA
jgi:phosphoserine phosphatase